MKPLKTSLGGYIVKNYLYIPVLPKRFVSILIVNMHISYDTFDVF